MRKKRDPIAEILQKRSRSRKKGPRWLTLNQRLDLIYPAIRFLIQAAEQKKDKEVEEELARYIPVALIAALEAYVRIAIRELINYGGTFRKNAKDLEEIRVDLATVLGVQGARISM